MLFPESINDKRPGDVFTAAYYSVTCIVKIFTPRARGNGLTTPTANWATKGAQWSPRFVLRHA